MIDYPTAMAYVVGMTIAEEVRALRDRLGENTATFGARWRRSGRTVETWEQGSRQPDPLVLDGMRALAKTLRAKAKKKAAGNT